MSGMESSRANGSGRERVGRRECLLYWEKWEIGSSVSKRWLGG